MDFGGGGTGEGGGLVIQIFSTKIFLKTMEKTSKYRIPQQEGEVCTFIIWLSGELGTSSVYIFQQ